MGVVRVFLWLVYEMNKYWMNLYWLLYIRWYIDGHLDCFAHMMGVLSFIVMISNIVYALTGTEA